MRLLLTCLLGTVLLPAVRADDRTGPSHLSPFSSPAPVLPVAQFHPLIRDKVKSVLEKPTLSARSVPETFNTDHAMYRYLLEHPDQGVKLWRQLGANVSDIDDKGSGTYRWHDGQGSEVSWSIVYRGQGIHAWYAEGKIKPSLLLAPQSFRAVAILQYTEGLDTTNVSAVRHQVYFHVRCESAAIAIAARIMGGSGPRLAEQYLGQLQTFYGSMGWYLFQDEQRARNLFAKAGLVYPFAPRVRLLDQ